jgi:hypothetical protein
MAARRDELRLWRMEGESACERDKTGSAVHAANRASCRKSLAPLQVRAYSAFIDRQHSADERTER